jgi:DNA-binding MarR family transcriptional regulator
VPADHFEDDIVAALRRIIRAVELHSRHLAEQVGLTGPQLVVLRMASQIGPVTTKALAQSVSLSQATVSDILGRLEKRGLVQRERESGDRRKVLVTATPNGEELLRDAPSLLQDRFTRRLMAREQFERTHILATLQEIASMMDAEDIAAAPILSAEPGASQASDEET